jgi:hypothetical protein
VIERYLVPASEPADLTGFTRVTQPLVNGLPRAIPLDARLKLVVALPTGVATLWRDADPAAVVSQAGVADGPPLRALLIRDGAVLASVPLVAGLARAIPDAGDPALGALIELRVLGWDVRAGCLRGAGDTTSFVDLAWRYP